MERTTYKQDDIVLVDNILEHHMVKARVVGIATTHMPIIGHTYILEDLSGTFPREDHPFTHFVSFESALHLV